MKALTLEELQRDYPTMFQATVQWSQMENSMSWTKETKEADLGPVVDQMSKQELEAEYIKLQDDYVDLFEDFEEQEIVIMEQDITISELEAELAHYRLQLLVTERALSNYE